MATSPHPTLSTHAGERPALGVLLVGRPSAAATGVFQATGRAAAGWHIEKTESILEAVLASGGEKSPVPALILAAVKNELDHLEAGVRSLRKVNPDARLVLLCEPLEEPVCRRALAWGADDYLLLPLDDRCLLEQMEHVNGTGGHRASRELSNAVRAVEQRSASATEHVQESHHKDVPALPLMVQTTLLEELLDVGAVGAMRVDFAERATATLAQHLGMEGQLKFMPATYRKDAAEPPASAAELQHVVALANQPEFGTLVWHGEPDDKTVARAAEIAQAANWLAAMLSVSQRYEQLRSMAITDELSGAYNRRYFMKFMSGLLERAKENRTRVTLLLFDIDNFKTYNDTFGHASGDAIIRELIKLLRACTREYDLVARVGGDEFAVVYRDNEAPRQPNSEHPRDVLVATERFRTAIRNHQWPQTCNIKGAVSISGGLATFPWDADSLESLMAKADEALLKAKAKGKNVILLHGSESAATGVTAVSP